MTDFYITAALILAGVFVVSGAKMLLGKRR